MGLARRQHPEVSQGVLAARPLGQPEPEGGHAGAGGAVGATVHRPLHDTRHDSSLTKPTDTARGARLWVDLPTRRWSVV